MATRRTTHDKRQRERSKQEKAAAKRERRLDKSPDEDVESDGLSSDEHGDATTEQLLERIQELHADYDAGRVSFEDFDEQRATLMDRIVIRLAE